jgi:hypothetical protein
MIKNFITEQNFAFTNLIHKNAKNGITVAEIGSFDGSTTIGYVKTIKKNKGKIYIVDWFKGNLNVVGPHGYNEDNHELILKQFKTNLSEYLDIIEIKDGKSQDMIPLIPDNSLDICFIDADHAYDSVYSDIKLCIPKVKKGGFLCGHDFEGFEFVNETKDPNILNKDCTGNPPRHQGVIQATFDHFGYDIELIGFNTWIKQL